MHTPTLLTKARLVAKTRQASNSWRAMGAPLRLARLAALQLLGGLHCGGQDAVHRTQGPGDFRVGGGVVGRGGWPPVGCCHTMHGVGNEIRETPGGGRDDTNLDLWEKRLCSCQQAFLCSLLGGAWGERCGVTKPVQMEISSKKKKGFAHFY